MTDVPCVLCERFVGSYMDPERRLCGYCWEEYQELETKEW